jgi:hypothetical protein
MVKYKIIYWIVGLFVIAVVLIIGSSTNWFLNWELSYNTFLYDLGYAILIGLIPSVLIGYISFKWQFERQLEVLNVSKNIIDAGVSDYNENWNPLILEGRLKDAKNVEMYMTYGRTVINNIRLSLKSKLQDEGFSIKIYIIDEKNPFVEYLGSFWAKDNNKYNSDGIRTGIGDSLEELKTIKENLKKNGTLNGNIEIYKLKYHPVFFSFYRFDDEIVFVPTKNVVKKNHPISSFVCNKTSDGGLFNWCNDQINEIRNIDSGQALNKVL